jgi:hypothetical protein
VRQYLEDYLSGNVPLLKLAASALLVLVEQLAAAGIGLRSAVLWPYDTIQRMRGCVPYPGGAGSIPLGSPTPTARLALQPGELVKSRSYEDISTTLNEDNHNRGMYFDVEMALYCGGEYRVLDRISRIIEERTGRMLNLKNDCIILDAVVCQGFHSKCRRFCPRSIYPYWREIWLERVVPPAPWNGEPEEVDGETGVLYHDGIR